MLVLAGEVMLTAVVAMGSLTGSNKVMILVNFVFKPDPLLQGRVHHHTTTTKIN
jgi:hypothetical protein